MPYFTDNIILHGEKPYAISLDYNN